MTLPYPYGEEVIAEINCPRLLALTCVTKVLAAPAMEDGLIAQGIFRKLVVIVTRPYSRTGHHDKIVSFFPCSVYVYIKVTMSSLTFPTYLYCQSLQFVISNF